MKKINEKKGFTLAELLIVVAIIAVLVAIAIPIFTTQLEKSREATDAANLRSAYAEATAAAVAGETFTAKDVDKKQSDTTWTYVTDKIGDKKASDITIGAKGWTVSVSGETVSIAARN